MMLERDVQINGSIYKAHYLAMLQCVPDDHITVTVENFTSIEAKDGGEMPQDTYCELPWPESGVIDAAEVEQVVWKLPEFEEARDMDSELDEAIAQIAERDALIQRLYGSMTAKQRAMLDEDASMVLGLSKSIGLNNK